MLNSRLQWTPVADLSLLTDLGVTDECYEEARRLLTQHRRQLDAIVEQLLTRETLDEADVYAAAGIPRSPADGTKDQTPVAATHRNGQR